MANNYFYVFECYYGARMKEREFLKGVLTCFGKDYATMVGVVVNNNPYCLEFSIVVNLQGDPVKFESWVRDQYPEKMRRHNVFLNDILFFNVVTFLDAEMVDLSFSREAGPLFLLPERALFEEVYPQYKKMVRNDPKVFIGHSSKDKEKIIGPLNSFLQSAGVGTWLDSYEIHPGDNIYLKVNEGIENSTVGIFVLTNDFFDSVSGWPITEFSTFFMSLMTGGKKVLIVNAGVDEEKIHAMMKTYKYLVWDEGRGLPDIANAVRRALATD